MADFKQGGIISGGGPRADISPHWGGCDYVVPKRRGGYIQGPGNTDGHVMSTFSLGEWVINADGTGQQVVRIAHGTVHFGPLTQLFDPDEFREAGRRALASLNIPEHSTD